MNEDDWMIVWKSNRIEREREGMANNNVRTFVKHRLKDEGVWSLLSPSTKVPGSVSKTPLISCPLFEFNSIQLKSSSNDTYYYSMKNDSPWFSSQWLVVVRPLRAFSYSCRCPCPCSSFFVVFVVLFCMIIFFSFLFFSIIDNIHYYYYDDYVYIR